MKTRLRNSIATCLIALFGFSFGVQAGETDGSVFGYKFNDLNGNGIDNDEPRLSGFKIYLKNLGAIPVLRTDTTDGDGEFEFNHLPFQSYEICEVAVPPWVPTTPECVVVVLKEKDSEASISFGNKRSTTGTGCTRTQGYWGSSPAGQALVHVLVPGTMPLGTVGYSATQIDSIFDAPVAGNAVLILAHQLMAAKLNILAGASSAPVAATITSADTAIGALVIPPVGAAFVAPASPLGTSMVNLANTLASYNEGNLQVPHCP